MALGLEELGILMAVFFFVALLYSSVGFGGGSSYLAILALALSSFFMIRSTALLCNLIVVLGSCLLFYRAGHLKLNKFIPFIVSSIPLAFLGASLRLKEHIFFIILGFSLVFAAIFLVAQTLNLKSDFKPKKYSSKTSFAIGGAVGFLSGLVGIGGGIFLAPILNYLKWEKPITIAALASFFILVNSISGISGLWYTNTFEVAWPQVMGLLVAVLLGGQIGVRVSLGKISAKGIRLLTAILVFFVGVRVVVTNGFQINLFQ